MFKINKKIIFTVFFTTISFFLKRSYSQENTSDFVVVLDAGHGGHDSGNTGNGFLEKKIALQTSIQIGNYIKSNSNIKVIYTRIKDRFVKLSERAAIANRSDADLFISIHCDAFTSSKVYGAGTFVLGLHRNADNLRIAQKENSVIFLEENYQSNYKNFDPNNPESVISLVLMQETYLEQSIEAANTIQKSFVTNLNRKDRTVKQAGFQVLRETYMPSVLVELGFLTNKKEGTYLNSKKGQKEMSETIAKGIINYRNKLVSSVFSKEKEITESREKPGNENIYKKRFADIVFKVQILVSSKSIRKSNFKSLKNISKSKEGKIFKYYYGNVKSYKEAKRLKNIAEKAGFKGAFIVAFKNEKKINISEVIDTNNWVLNKIILNFIIN